MLLRYILNYLRNGELRYPNDRVFQEDLLSEAKFFQVQGMIDHLEISTGPLKSFTIIKDKSHRLTVMSWLPRGATCFLLYRASTDGGTPLDFHPCCDKKGPTLLVIEEGVNGVYL